MFVTSFSFSPTQSNKSGIRLWCFLRNGRLPTVIEACPHREANFAFVTISSSRLCKMKLAGLAFVLLAIQGVNLQCISKDDTKITSQTVKDTLYRGQLNFTLSIFEAINKAQPQGNIFFSPYSIYHALLLAYFASANHTEASIMEALKLDKNETKVDVMRSYKLDQFVKSVRQTESYEFNSANRVYVDSNLPVRECMLSFFQDELEKLDIRNNPDKSREYINEFVYNQTKGNIKDIITKDGIDELTRLVLVNAAYFKGVWTSRFDANSTEKEVFYASADKQTFVTMMKQKGKFNYGISEELGAHILEMPYKGDDVSMFVLLPPFADQQGIDKVLNRLKPDILSSIVNLEALLPQKVEVEFPKFTIEKSLPLRYVLEMVGVGDLFEPTSDFSWLTGEIGPHFSDATHKAKIKIDENGTVAAAATAIFSFRSSRPVEQPQFICNHPFVYFIYDKPTKTIIFMGVFRDPKDLS